MSTERIDLEGGREQRESEQLDAPRIVPAVDDLHATERTAATGQIVVAIFAVLAACYFAKLVLVVLLVSALLAFILAPFVDLLERWYIHRSLGAVFVVLLMCGAVYGMSYYSYSKAQDFVNDWPKYREKVQDTIRRVQSRAERIRQTAQDVIPQSGEQQPAQPGQPAQQPQTGRGRGRSVQPQPPPQVQTVKVEQSSGWGDWLSKGAGSVTEILFAIGFIPFLVYFMLSWQEHVRANTVMLFRMENRNTAYVTLGAISRMIRSFIIGNVIVGIFMSLMAMMVFGFLHLPYFYFVAFISGFLSLIPYLGVVLALVPPILAGLGQIGTSQLVIIIATVLGLHVFSLNVLYPKIVGSRVQLNPLAVTVALLMWGWLWGAMGLILAVPITAGMKIIFDHVDSLRAYGAWMGE